MMELIKTETLESMGKVQFLSQKPLVKENKEFINKTTEKCQM